MAEWLYWAGYHYYEKAFLRILRLIDIFFFQWIRAIKTNRTASKELALP